MTPTEELCTAADRLESLADTAPPPPWTTVWIGQDYNVLDSTGDMVVEAAYVVSDNGVAGYRREECGQTEDYLAAMHPGVAKALAAWLRDCAAFSEKGLLGVRHERHAFAVARAINGGGS